MFKLIVLFALVAVAYAAPGYLGAGLAAPVAYAGHAVAAAPLGYAAAPLGYAASPLGYAASPLAYHGAIGAPLGYHGAIIG